MMPRPRFRCGRFAALAASIALLGAPACSSDPSSPGAPQEGALNWVQQISDSGSGAALALHQLRVTDNAVYVCGSCSGGATFPGTSLVGHGNQDGYFARFGLDGTFLGASLMGGSGLDVLADLDVTDDGVAFAVGYFLETAVSGSSAVTSAGITDALLMRFEANGDVAWMKRSGGEGTDFATAVSVDGAGDVIVAGAFTGPAEFGTTTLTGSGDRDLFVLKYDADGNERWIQKATGVGSVQVNAMTHDGSDQLYVAGMFSGDLEFPGHTLVSTATWSSFVAAFGSSGAFRWARQTTGDDNVVVGDLTWLPGGEIVVAGDADGPADFGGVPLDAGSDSFPFLWAMDSDGQTSWAKDYLTPRASIRGVGPDGRGGILMTGSFEGETELGDPLASGGGFDAYFAWLDASGTPAAAYRIGGAGDVSGLAAMAHANGDLYGGGKFEDDIDVFGHSLPKRRVGSYSIYLFGQGLDE